MKILLFAYLLVFNISVFAQENLSGGLTGSVYKYIYKLKQDEAVSLFKSGLNNVSDKYLHSLTDSFPSNNRDLPTLSKGNYLIVYAKENEVYYNLETIGDVNYKLLNNDRDLVVALHNKLGQLIADADMYIGRKRIPFDPSTQAYRLNKRKKAGSLVVSKDGVAYFFPIELKKDYRYGYNRRISQRIRSSFPLKYIFNSIGKISSHYGHRYTNYFFGNTNSESRFRGYMIFNKPMYKPGDTVKLKAYVMRKNGKPLDEPLILRLTDQSFSPDTIISIIKPYRNGGYSYEFVLSDSLDLDLDDNYLLTLEQLSSRKYDLDNYEGDLDDNEYASKRKIVMRGKFKYEEYELKSIAFKARSDLKAHSRGREVSVYLKATDENDMAVMDGRVQVLVKTLPYSSKLFFQPKVFLPDTLYYHEVQLDAIGETKVTLPDSIFPAASFDYEINCNFLNSDNERRSQTLTQSFKGEKYAIAIERRNDSLIIDHFINGALKPANALLYAFNHNDDTLEIKQIQLPVHLSINPFARTYSVKTDSARQFFELSQSSKMVTAQAVRTKDSVSIQLVNPHQLKVWYTLFAGKRVFQRGYTDSLLFIDKTRTKKNYFISLQYVYEGEIKREDYTIPFQDKVLNIKVDQPTDIYPGQAATVNLSVTDAIGKDVAGADISAYAFTKKFENPQVPNIPYMGKIYPGRKNNNSMFIAKTMEFTYASEMNWRKWSLEMALDTIEYYKFTHPYTIYQNTEPSKDSVTQVAPFVVRKGNIEPVHLIYIDEQPVFFSQSDNLKRYSFQISPGVHRLSMRIKNKSITLDSVVITKGAKTFISVSSDTSTDKIRVQAMPDTLTNYEKTLWSKYMILVENNYGENLTYIKQGNNFYLINGNNQLRNNGGNLRLIGPLSNQYADLVVENKFYQSFEVEGAYQYIISKGLIKQKQLKNPYPFNGHLNSQTQRYNFKDFVLTAAEIDSLWQDYLDHRSANEDLFYNATLNQLDNGQLQISVGRENPKEDLFVKNILLFRNDDPDFLRVYKGVARQLGYLRPGDYRLLLLLKNDDYFLMDNISVMKGGINFYETGTIVVRLKDSTSKAMAKIINDRQRNQSRYENADLDRLKLTFNDRYVDISSFEDTTTGKITDDNSKPIAAALITIKGLKWGTLSDEGGNFRLSRPKNAVLVISCVGYDSKEVLAKNEFEEIRLKPAEMSLQDVVVTGYGIQRKRALTGSVSSFSSSENMLMGSVAGISIRGVSSVAGSPLIILNGVPYSGSMSDIDQSLVGNVTVMKSDVAIAIYGQRAAGGVIIVTTKTANDVPANLNMANANSLRRNFHDDAYWQPRLITDVNGKASFKVTFPDDITNWQTYVIAIADKKRTGFVQGAIRSFKALSSTLALPQFLVEGDSVNVIGKVLNYLPDSIAVRRTFSINDSLVTENSVHLRNSRIDTFMVAALQRDSLKFKYTIRKDDGYFDGEERSIPVFKPGTLETKGLFAALLKDTTFSLQFDLSLGAVKLYAEASLLPVMLEEIEHIRNYEYLCNEQLASKLKALLLKKKVYKYLQKDFKDEKNISDIITKLDQNKTRNLWGWWNNTDPLVWISLHVVEALIMAEQSGYKTNLNKLVITDYLVYNLGSYKGSEKLLALELLQAIKAKVNYKNYIDSLEKNYWFKSLYEKLTFLNIKQNAGLLVSLDTVITKSRRTMFGNLYWGEDEYLFFDNVIQNTILMYKLLKSNGKYEDQLSKIRNYFLEKRKDGKWRNTYESSLILETILPDLLANESSATPSTLTISGAQQTKVTSFPFSMTTSGNEKLTVSKQGALPVYFTAYQQRWNINPDKVDTDFKVSSSFKKNDQAVTLLKAGEPVQLNVHVTVKSDADYVMLEIPIPAGCSYQDKNQSYLNNEVHREYFKNKTSIFCRELKKGSYTFVVSLLPRYTGSFQLNPSKAEMMYFPVFYGREAMKKVKIF